MMFDIKRKPHQKTFFQDTNQQYGLKEGGGVGEEEVEVEVEEGGNKRREGNTCKLEYNLMHSTNNNGYPKMGGRKYTIYAT